MNDAGRPSVEPIPRLALTRQEAANSLGLGVRSVWLLTNRGELPVVRCGTRVLYPVDALRRWLAAHSEGGEQ